MRKSSKKSGFKLKTPASDIKASKYLRYDFFNNYEENAFDPFLDDIARKITVLTMRVSHIENRLSFYETQRAIPDIDKENYLKDPGTSVRYQIKKRDKSKSSSDSITKKSPSGNAKNTVSNSSYNTSQPRTRTNISSLLVSPASRNVSDV